MKYKNQIIRINTYYLVFFGLKFLHKQKILIFLTLKKQIYLLLNTQTKYLILVYFYLKLIFVDLLLENIVIR